jgi:cell division protein FtsB
MADLYSAPGNALFSHAQDVRSVKQPRPTAATSPPTTPPRRRRRAVQYLLVFIGCVIVVDALVGDKGLLAMMKARQEYRALEDSLEHARADNARLREQARRLREDPSAIEEIARRELGLVKPGEKLFIVKDVPPADAHH